MIIPAYPTFNIYSKIAKTTTALGPLMVATVVSMMKGWDVEVIDENNYRRFGPKDGRGRPDHGTLQAIRRTDVVGLYGGLSSTIPRLNELVRFYKEKGVTVIVGGQHFVGSNIGEALEGGVDFVVIGEGESTIKELLEVICAGGELEEVAGIAFMRDGRIIRTRERDPITNFDELPLPNFNLVRYAKIKLYPVGWIRGCGMNCEFCTVKGKPRAAEVERVVEQIAALLESHNARHFFIVDDLFGHKREDTMRLCSLLAEYQKAVGRRLDITVQIRLDRAKDTEMLHAMRRAGIYTVAIGFESPIAEELKAMDKRIHPEDMISMTRLYHQAGFLVHGMFIFGYPLPEGLRLNISTAERIRIFRTFIKQARLDTIQVLLPAPLPGTELTDRLAAQNRIFPLDCVGWEYYDGNFPLFRPDEPLTPKEMQSAIRKIMGRFYRFRSMFAIGINILTFPSIIFSLFNIKVGWRKWYRPWRTNLLRFGGWIIVKRWTTEFKKDSFMHRLTRAEQRLLRDPEEKPDDPH
ncbi:MAG: B12-binding domain-containing radical SAM protein [Candidatus Krumholzibacteriota bacterium]|nr:B12-binding domain-containing radical SAM protein [Candidatus Krumholzibacteriota bacterium]